MKINQTPYRTSRNYQINNIEVAEDIFNKKLHTFTNFDVENAEKFRLKTGVNTKTEVVIDAKLTEQLTKFANKKVSIDIDKDTEVPIIFTYNLDKQNDSLADVLNINIAENVKAQVVVRYLSNVDAYHNGLIKVSLAKNSNLELCIVTSLRENSKNFVLFENDLQTDAKLNQTIIDFGCAISVQNFHTNLAGQGAKNHLKSMYVGKGQDVLDLNYLQSIYGENAKATMEVVGALNEQACKNFKGTIDFKKGCKKSVGEEEEFCMLLSKSAKSKALPMLLCGEEDVDGSHSSSVGKVDAKELFYVMSRGFDEKEAIKLIVKAKLNAILNTIFDEDLKQETIREIDRKLDDEKN